MRKHLKCIHLRTKISSLKGLGHSKYSTKLHFHKHAVTTFHSSNTCLCSIFEPYLMAISWIAECIENAKELKTWDGKTFLHREFLNVGHLICKNNDWYLLVHNQRTAHTYAQTFSSVWNFQGGSHLRHSHVTSAKKKCWQSYPKNKNMYLD